MVGPGGVGTSSEQALRHFMSHTHIRALSGVGGGDRGPQRPAPAKPQLPSAGVSRPRSAWRRRVGWGQHRKGQDWESQTIWTL